jgi:hypothetical protein
MSPPWWAPRIRSRFLNSAPRQLILQRIWLLTGTGEEDLVLINSNPPEELALGPRRSSRWRSRSGGAWHRLARAKGKNPDCH